MPTESPWLAICPGVKRRTLVVGQKLYQMYAILDAGARMPAHQHVHEQIATCIKGRLRLIVDGNPVEAGPGESIHLPSNVPHGAEVDVETHVIDTFSPPREDLIAADKNAYSA
jgi:quercetin dioxygenase-like cupin family protein